jgi:hypothetical protein
MEGYSYSSMKVGDKNVITENSDYMEQVSEYYIRESKSEHILSLKQAGNVKKKINNEDICPRCQNVFVLAVFEQPKMKMGSYTFIKKVCPDVDCGISYYYEFRSE